MPDALVEIAKTAFAYGIAGLLIALMLAVFIVVLAFVMVGMYKILDPAYNLYMRFFYSKTATVNEDRTTYEAFMHKDSVKAFHSVTRRKGKNIYKLYTKRANGKRARVIVKKTSFKDNDHDYMYEFDDKAFTLIDRLNELVENSKDDHKEKFIMDREDKLDSI